MEPHKDNKSDTQIIKIEEWLVLILLGMIPVINLIAFLYFSFSKKINPNKRNFSRAVLIYLSIIIILVVLTTVLL